MPNIVSLRDKAISWSKIAKLFITPAFDVLVEGSLSEYCHYVWYGKLEWWSTRWRKKFDHMFSYFDTIPACNGRTDGQTDILWQHNPREYWRDLEMWVMVSSRSL